MQYHFWYTKQPNDVRKENINTLMRTECSLTFKIGDQLHKLSKFINTGINSIVTLTTWKSRNEIHRPNIKVLLWNWHRDKQTWLLESIILSLLAYNTTTYNVFTVLSNLGHENLRN